MYKSFLYIASLIVIGSCNNQEKLPYLGNSEMDGEKVVHHKIRPFSFYNQDSIVINSDTLKRYIYIADFFFTSCPSICPKVMKEMLKIHEAVKDNPNIRLVSFTIDPKRDTPEKLKLYAGNLGIHTKNWHFLSGDKDFTLDLANDFFVVALEDPEAPGGFDHSGKIILVDQDGHVRSFTEGTDSSKTDQFIEDIFKLLEEMSL